jgi:ClpP class serine protease
MFNLENFWAGTEASYLVAAQAHQQATAKAGISVPSDLPSLYERQGSVGVVQIRGSLVPGSAGWGRYFGVLGYDDIRAGVLEALADPDCTSILYHFHSGGGAVTGMSDTATFMQQASKLKPSVAFVDVAASAAYRLAIETSEIIVADSGLVGSIGVLRIHGESSKQLEQDGLKITVLRAGEHKALLNPYEALTPEAIAQETERLQHLAKIFNSAVESRRGLSADDMKASAGEGREFLGQMGVKVGLADKVGTYESALKAATRSSSSPKLKASVAGTLAETLNTAQNAVNNLPDSIMPKPTFTVEQLAAIAAGSTEGVTAAAVAAELTATLATLASTQEELEALKLSSSTTLNGVQAQLDTAVAAATVSEATIKTQGEKIVSLDAILVTAQGIVNASLDNMTVALGGSAGSVAAGTAFADLLAKHAEVAATYTAKFKGGCVAVPPKKSEAAAPAASPANFMLAAVIASTKPVQ